MDNISEASIKELINTDWIFTIEISNEYKINLESIEGYLPHIENLVMRNISRLESLNLKDNEYSCLNAWINLQNIIKAIYDRIPVVVEQYNQVDEQISINDMEILNNISNGSVSISYDDNKYRTIIPVNSFCDEDTSYELIIEFIKAFRREYENDSNFYVAIFRFIDMQKNNVLVGSNFSSTYYYQTFPAHFWLEQLIKSIKLDTTLVEQKIERINNTINEECSVASRIRNESKAFFDERINETKLKLKAIDENASEAENRLKQLEAAYKEKLKLEAPEILWDERSKNQIRSIVICIILIVVTVGVLIYLLSNYLIPLVLEATPKNNLLITPTSMLVLITAFMIYIIKVEIKFLTSSWHLKSVYQQKAALTRFYQALVADGSVISEEERLLIMQSLFSEVNTGLVNNSDKSDFDVLISSILKK